MGNIVLLDELTINQIAAGEVIERPANVVKEMVENSIDAGADKIVIEIRKGGKSLIKISDNGKGIEIDDIPFSIERHATSKIRQIEDLENTYTMGFRGEALASIASISKLTITSRTEENKLGARVIVEGGEVVQASEFACQQGTTMVVENLFYNTPVRYKFLKNDGTEFRYIKELIQDMALANPNVSLKLINDGKMAFFTNGNGNLRDVVYVIYGKEVSENLVDVDYTEDDIHITGLVGNSYMAKDNRRCQTTFLNRRNITSPILINSADQAFKGSIGIGKYGFYIINIEMPANMYDVNVHPTKKDVRFKDEDYIYKVLYRAIKTSILDKEFLGDSEEAIDRNKYVDDEFSFLTSNYGSKSADDGSTANNKYNFFGKNFANEEIVTDSANLHTDILNSSDSSDSNEDIFTPPGKKKYGLGDPRFADGTAVGDENINHEEFITRDNKRRIDFRYLGILFKTYIVIEIGDDLYLIDQHAGHERILYEQIKANYKNKLTNETQMTFIPEVIDLTNKEIEFVKNNIDMFKNVGYDIEIFGDSSVKLNGIPDIDYREKTNNKDAFMDVLDEMITNSRSPIKDIEERFIATVACKAAVKAGMDLGIKEIDYLINNLLILQNPYTCPHGRPTTIKFSKNDFRKLHI